MSTTLLENVLELFPGWELAIAEAERGAMEAEQRAVRLRAVASVFKRKMNAGEPWPGDVVEQAATPLRNASTQN